MRRTAMSSRSSAPRRADNVTWVLHLDASAGHFAAYYPGARWVDWVGLSAYGAQEPGDPWTSFDSVFAPAYRELAAAAPGKPIALLEVGVIVEAGHDKAAWIRAAYSRHRERSLPPSQGRELVELELAEQRRGAVDHADRQLPARPRRLSRGDRLFETRHDSRLRRIDVAEWLISLARLDDQRARSRASAPRAPLDAPELLRLTRDLREARLRFPARRLADLCSVALGRCADLGRIAFGLLPGRSITRSISATSARRVSVRPPPRAAA